MVCDDPLLSVCIPTYNNSVNLQKVIGHVLELEYERLELVVCDDGSTENTNEVISGFEDDRIRYFENEDNLGFEKNLFHCIELADGQYIMPLADEDKIVTENLQWAISLIENPNIGFSSIIAGYGPVSADGYDWEESVPLMQEFEKGYDSLAAFVNTIPHPFANHTWRRNYIGGFILKRSAIDLEAAADYFGSLYIHNALLLQAMVDGRTILSSRHLSLADHYQYEDDHRFWSEFDWSNLELRVRLQKYRLKAVDEILTDEASRALFTRVETRFAAQLAAWATIQKDMRVEALKQEALSSEIYPLNSIWESRQFKRFYLYYLLVFPLPVARLKTNIQTGLIPRRAFPVWYHLAARLLPDSLDRRIRN